MIQKTPRKPSPDARVQVAVRLAPASLVTLDELADTEERTRSDMVRILLKEAIEARRRKAQLGR